MVSVLSVNTYALFGIQLAIFRTAQSLFRIHLSIFRTAHALFGTEFALFEIQPYFQAIYCLNSYVYNLYKIKNRGL